MRLRRKITIAFFLVSSLVSILLALFLYRFIERQLQAELRSKLLDVAHVGAAELEEDAIRSLRGKLGALDDAGVAAVEATPEYKEIYSHLRMLRRTEPELMQYAYVLTPTDDPENPKFLVDADVLDYNARLARGEQLPEGESVSHFNLPYPVKDIPLLAKALEECSTQLEPDFVWDEKFKVSSISAYVPMTDDEGKVLRDGSGRCVAVLGLDITDRQMRAALNRAGGLAIKISLLMLVVALIVSIALSTLLTRSILALTSTVKRFADKDFSARTPVLSKDEVGQLGENFNAMAATIQEHNENLEELVHKRTKELSDEKQTSERLLLNVLPAPIADRLKSGEGLIVDRFDAVTVLFADIVGFTSLSSRIPPEQLVTMLNELFSAFDKLAEQHGLEKIKTIGDAYMVVAGVPVPIANHAAAITHMALDMQLVIDEFAKKHASDLTIRIGIHTGPVVAGVIGQKKFIYDLWGDTVNTASRMESHGVPGRVHVSAATFALLQETFELEPRDPIEIKGKGRMQTYLVIGAKAG
ncbi:MAG TPA: adenylate/guanylate cyclase domain-containing protein [Kofleriaceae bacterium]|nr:adenylate/guanylate cyclase domain-containing protein [Kofleriaceae bacterium]